MTRRALPRPRGRGRFHRTRSTARPRNGPLALKLALEPTRSPRNVLALGFSGIGLFVWGASRLDGEIAVLALVSGLTFFLGALVWGAVAR